MQRCWVAAVGLCGIQGFGDAEGDISWSPFRVLPCRGRVGAGPGAPQGRLSLVASGAEQWQC